MRDGHATSLGAASGMVAGLVAITPCCWLAHPRRRPRDGRCRRRRLRLAVGLKYRFGYDDSLDVVGVHLVGGLVGTFGIGLLATAAAPTGVDGLLYGGGVDQLGKQLLGGTVVLALRLRRLGSPRAGRRPGHGLPGRRGARGQRDRPRGPRRDRLRPARHRRDPARLRAVRAGERSDRLRPGGPGPGTADRPRARPEHQPEPEPEPEDPGPETCSETRTDGEDCR